MKTFTFKVGATPKTLTGTLTWSPNGTLDQLVIADQFNSANSQTCNYAYDDLARLSSASCGAPWSQTFTYDRYGNVFKSGNGSFQPTYSAATNRMTYASSGSTDLNFTSMAQDVVATNAGIYDFPARKYSPVQGRWLSPDAGQLNLKYLLNPQKWNKYSYTINDPLKHFDPNGEEEVEIQFRAFISQTAADLFRGDNRGFSTDRNASSRTSVTVLIETDPKKNNGNPIIGKPEIKVQPTHFLPTGTEKTSTGPQLPQVTATQDKNGVTVNIQQNVRNPIVDAGSGIKADVNITVTQDASSAEVKGSVSGSPSFEALL
jgi:RHS repeat-associated protein